MLHWQLLSFFSKQDLFYIWKKIENILENNSKKHQPRTKSAKARPISLLFACFLSSSGVLYQIHIFFIHIFYYIIKHILVWLDSMEQTEQIEKLCIRSSFSEKTIYTSLHFCRPQTATTCYALVINKIVKRVCQTFWLHIFRYLLKLMSTWQHWMVTYTYIQK